MAGGAREAVARLIDELGRYIVGHGDLIRLMVVSLISGGHILVEGAPGTGKTVSARLLAMMVGGVFRRIHMTPDLLPSDVLGGYYYDLARGEWVLRQGPVFANILLVDEIDMAPPRTQSALLEVMQEGRVSIDGRMHEVPQPFLVIATRVSPPLEGAYSLTPVFLDRFAYSYRSYNPDPEHEVEILRRADAIDEAIYSGKASAMLSPGDILEAREEVRKIYVSDEVRRYIVDLVGYVRRSSEIQIPPSPRASIWLLRGARALAYLEGLDYVAPDHVKAIAESVLAHRVFLKPESELRGVKPLDIVHRALKEVPVPRL